MPDDFVGIAVLGCGKSVITGIFVDNAGAIEPELPVAGHVTIFSLDLPFIRHTATGARMGLIRCEYAIKGIEGIDFYCMRLEIGRFSCNFVC